MDFMVFQYPMITVQACLDGILLGILFALIAYGMALQWGVMNIINIAQGDLVILGGYIAYFMYLYGIHPAWGVIVAPVIMYFLGVLIYKLVINKVVDRDLFISILATSEYSKKTIEEIIKNKIPIFGICLGHQLLGLSLGAKTKKMHHGHHGVNQPVKNLLNKSIEITSQNHGFMIDLPSLPKQIKVSHISLFDNVIQGLEHKSKLFFSVQYHPESSPGPHDSRYLFKKFKNLINKNKNA